MATHFLPLGQVLRNAVQYAAAIAITLADAVALAHAPHHSEIGIGLGTGIVLWATAGAQLVRGYMLLRPRALQRETT